VAYSQQQIYAATEAFSIGRLIAQQMSIKEDVGVPVTPREAPRCMSALILCPPVAFHVTAELLDIQPKFARIRNENWKRSALRPGALIAIKPIMHLPELLLIARGLGGVGRGEGVLVHLHQREVMKTICTWLPYSSSIFFNSDKAGAHGGH